MGPLKHPLQTEADQLRDGVDMRYHFCACGRVISQRAKRCRPCAKRRAQAKYQRSEKGRATQARYDASPKRLDAVARYSASAKGKRTRDTLNARRIFIGDHYHGRAQNVEQAAAINRYAKERLSVFQGAAGRRFCQRA